MQKALQMATSSSQLSHQHSLKLGSQCLNVFSHSSNAIDTHHLRAHAAGHAGGQAGVAGQQQQQR